MIDLMSMVIILALIGSLIIAIVMDSGMITEYRKYKNKQLFQLICVIVCMQILCFSVLVFSLVDNIAR